MFYERDPAHLPEATLLLTGENGPNLKPYFRNDKVRFEFEVTGTSSARSVLSLTGCFYTKARIDWARYRSSVPKASEKLTPCA